MTSSPKSQIWFAEARSDLNAGNALLTISDDYLKKSAFFAQQCVEKAFKGFLTHHKKRTKKTHDMRTLAHQVIGVEADLETLLQPSGKMTIYAVATRYPDAASSEVDQLTKAQVTELLRYAESILIKLRGLCAE